MNNRQSSIKTRWFIFHLHHHNMCNYNGQKLFLQSTRIHFRISAEWSLTVFRSPTEATILESGDQAQPLIFAFDFRVRIKFPPSSKSQSLSVESWEADTRRRLPSRAKLRSLIIPVWSIRSSFRHPAKKHHIFKHIRSDYTNTFLTKRFLQT